MTAPLAPLGSHTQPDIPQPAPGPASTARRPVAAVLVAFLASLAGLVTLALYGQVVAAVVPALLALIFAAGLVRYD